MKKDSRFLVTLSAKSIFIFYFKLINLNEKIENSFFFIINSRDFVFILQNIYLVHRERDIYTQHTHERKE